MAHYFRRERICECLRMSRWQSYQYVGPSFGSRISSDAVLDLLNHARRGIAEPLQWLPSDLRTPEELAADLAGSDITVHDLMNWAKRTKAVPPHFHLSKRTVRFPKKMFMAWLDERSQVKTLKVRVA